MWARAYPLEVRREEVTRLCRAGRRALLAVGGDGWRGREHAA